MGGPTPGRLIQIHGQVPPSSSRWYINLQNGPGSLPGDIAFHFNPRYDAGAPYVVKNNRRHGGWGAEERESSCPINRGQNFEILILIDPAEFKVQYIDLEFEYRKIYRMFEVLISIIFLLYRLQLMDNIMLLLDIEMVFMTEIIWPLRVM